MAQKNMKAIYDSCRLLIKQAREQFEKDQTVDTGLQETIEKTFFEILDFVKFFLIKATDKFWGVLLMELDLSVCSTQKGATDLIVSQTPYVLNVNPFYCENYTFSELVGVIISELVRLLYLHPAEYGKINKFKEDSIHKLLESASDVAAHTVVKHDIRVSHNEDSSYNKNACRLPRDSETVESLNHEFKLSIKEDMPLSYYYEIIKKFRKKDQLDGNSPGSNTGESQPNSGMGNGNGVPKSGQGGGNSTAPSIPGSNNGTDVHQWEGEDEDSVSDGIKSLVSEAYNSLPDKSRGYMPGNVLAQIKKILAPPEINWKQVLKKMIGSIPVPYRKTKVRLNRRQPLRADLSGRLPKRTVNVVCAFDTSGSMSDDMIAYCMNEVFNIVKVYEGSKITIIECDAEIGKIYEAKRISDVQTKVSGRGGTSFIPVIQYINGEKEYKNSKNKMFTNSGKYKDALLVYFTDGYGDSAIPKPKTYRNLWVVFGDTSNLSVKEPFGDVKSIRGDADFKKRFYS